MSVVAMTREMGSRGKDVAALVAKRLDLEIVHHELVEHDVAEHMGVRESTVHKFLESRPTVKERWTVDKFELALHTAEELLSLAERGDMIIRGWGATRLLRPVSHVLSLRVCAPMRLRVETLMERIGLDDPALAEREIRKNDEAHRRVLWSLFDAEWESPLNYDMVLNTERLPIETCADMVVDLLRRPAFQETSESRKTLQTLKIEAGIKSAVRRHADLRDMAATWNADIIDPDTGVVTLTGGVATDLLGSKITDVVGGVAGVREVRNELIVSTRYTTS